MAVVPICYKMSYKDQTLRTQNVSRHSDKFFLLDRIAVPEGSRCFASISNDTCRKWQVLYPTADIFTKTKARGVNAANGMTGIRSHFHFWNISEVHALQPQGVCNAESHLRSFSEHATHREKVGTVWYALDSSTTERQLSSLDTYFVKLQNDTNQSSSDSCIKTELRGKSDQINAKKELSYLDAYFGKLKEVSNSGKYDESSTYDEPTSEDNLVETPFSISEGFQRENGRKLRSYMVLRNNDDASGSERSQLLQPHETSDLYLISILASINIAVFLFELASPVPNSDLGLFSLPSLYGAKINDMILVGEWWRLVTPMFLHSGPLHVALSCWALLTFGPQVCKGYGSFTFFLIYTLGGFSGNLTSFLHTPEPTVGGTGPVFAIIGAWLIYQIQNKDATTKDVTESMFQKAIFTTALCFILSHFGPIDDWTHLGAIFTGLAYGYFTCPSLQLDDASSRTGREEGITLVRRFADPCKSLIIFTAFIIVLSSLTFFLEPTLISIEVEDFLI